MQVVPIDEGDCDAAVARTSRTADAVQVRLIVFGTFPVDHMGDVRDIDPTGRNIGCDKNVYLAISEGAKCLLARALPEIAVHRSSGESALSEIVGDFLRVALGATENDRQSATLGLQSAGDQFLFVEAMCTPYVLFNSVDG